ncbi:MAG: STAS domain-containing protein [Phycisphaerae bacterium]
MPIESWSEDLQIVHLANDPQFADDLESVDEKLKAGTPLRLVFDFQQVEFMNSSNIGQLLRVKQSLERSGGRAILCAIPPKVWGTLLVSGMDKVFTVTENVPMAIATLQLAEGDAK